MAVNPLGLANDPTQRMEATMKDWLKTILLITTFASCLFYPPDLSADEFIMSTTISLGEKPACYVLEAQTSDVWLISGDKIEFVGNLQQMKEITIQLEIARGGIKMLKELGYTRKMLDDAATAKRLTEDLGCNISLIKVIWKDE